MEPALIVEPHLVIPNEVEPGLFRLVGGVARDAILVADLRGRIVYWNPAAETIFGYPVDEAVGEPLTLLMPERYRAVYQDGLARYRTTGEGILPSRTIELQGRRKSGAEFPMELTVAGMDFGDSTLFAAIVRDVTDRVRSAQELNRGEQTFRALVDGVVDHAIFRLSPEGVVETWNTGAHRILGFQEFEIIGRPLSTFYSADDLSRGLPRQALATAEKLGHFEDEGWRQRKDGRRLWASVTITALRDGHSRLTGFAMVTRDLTERRRAATELRQSEQRYRLLVENNPDRAIYQLNREGIIETWNLGGENIHGYKAAEIVGRPGAMLCIPEDAAAGQPRRTLDVAIKAGRSEDEGWRLRKDGTRFWASVVLSALRDGAGVVYGFAVVTRDLTLRREAEEKERRLAEEHVARAVAEQGQHRAREQAQRIQILEESAAQFSAVPGNLSDTLATIAKRCSDVLGDGCIIELLTADHKELDVRALHHRESRARTLGHTQLLGKRVPKSGLGKMAIDSNTAVVKVATDPREIAASAGQAVAECFEALPIRSLAAVPLVAEGEVVGVLEMMRHSADQPYQSNDVMLLQALADRAGAAVSRARQFEAVADAREAAERSALRMTRLQAATAALAEAKTPQNAADATLKHGAELFGLTEGAVYRVEDDGTLSQLASMGDLAASDAPVSPSEPDQPASVCVRTGEAFFFPTAESLTARFADTRSLPFLVKAHSAMLLPIRVEGVVRGVVALSDSGRSQPFEADDRRLAESFAQQCALAIDRTLLAEAEHRGAERASLLADASAVFSSSLDPQEVLDRLVKVFVPRLADWSVVDMREGETTRQAALAHADPGRLHWAREASARHVADRSNSSGPWHVIQTGEPELFEEIPESLSAEGAQDDEHLRVFRALGMASGLVVPLIARGTPIGALTLVAERARRYDLADVAFAQEIAHRAALALDNARLYRDLAQAVQARDDFLSVAGHELKTPLATMLVRLDILARAATRTAIGVRVVEQVWRAQAAGQRLELLIDELLDVSRVGIGRLRLNVEQTDLAKLVREVAAGLKEPADKAGCEVTLHVPDSLTGDWDRLRLEAVLSNLLRNAFKYGGGKPVEITLDSERLDARLRVTDHGIGIAADRQDAIFERFGRPDSSREFGGLGLGLWLSRQVIEASGGTISVQSIPGEGATFTVRLPMT